MLHVLAGLSTGHKIGLGVVGAVFIAFALSASFLAPRRWPDFPGPHGLSPFVIACFVVFTTTASGPFVSCAYGEGIVHDARDPCICPSTVGRVSPVGCAQEPRASSTVGVPPVALPFSFTSTDVF